MKFGNILKSLVAVAPTSWRDQFLSYNELKKRLKTAEIVLKRPRIESMGPPESGDERDDSAGSPSNGSNQADNFHDIKDKLSMMELDFIKLLNVELAKVNEFFVAKEKEYISRQKELQERIERVRNTVGSNGKHDMIKVMNDVVNFHGEIVLLEHYCILNFTGLGKITKKYDKKTGGILRLVFIQKVLGQPFFTSWEHLFKLVKQCEETIHLLLSSPEKDEEREEETAETAELYRSIKAARRSMQEMRKGSSTYGPFSLPPLHHSADENPKGSSM